MSWSWVHQQNTYTHTSKYYECTWGKALQLSKINPASHRVNLTWCNIYPSYYLGCSPDCSRARAGVRHTSRSSAGIAPGSWDLRRLFHIQRVVPCLGIIMYTHKPSLKDMLCRQRLPGPNPNRNSCQMRKGRANCLRCIEPLNLFFGGR